MSGETTGNLIVTVSGGGFSHACDARCDFKQVQIVQATYDAQRRVLLCQPPPGSHLLSTAVEVSLNAQQYTADGVQFTYYTKHSIDAASPGEYRVCPAPCTEPVGWEPAWGATNASMVDVQPASSHLYGGTTVTIKGTGFLDYWTLQCKFGEDTICLLYTSPSPRDGLLSRMPSSA